jgi:bifunctional DNase/RNase
MDDHIFEMKIKGLTLDPMTNMPIIILKDVEGKRALPIWIGLFEANAIALEIEKVETPRPMTHDLMVNVLKALEARLTKVIVHDLKDNTFFASLVIEGRRGELTVDSRPSDAIALAVRCQAPIFVTREVLDKSQSFAVDEGLLEQDQMKKWLENLKPEDFGKYPT